MYACPKVHAPEPPPPVELLLLLLPARLLDDDDDGLLLLLLDPVPADALLEELLDGPELLEEPELAPDGPLDDEVSVAVVALAPVLVEPPLSTPVLEEVLVGPPCAVDADVPALVDPPWLAKVPPPLVTWLEPVPVGECVDADVEPAPASPLND